MEELADHPWLYKNVYILKNKEEPVKLMTVKEEIPKEKPKVKAPVKSTYAAGLAKNANNAHNAKAQQFQPKGGRKWYVHYLLQTNIHI